MLDKDLALLYNVETRVLNQAVRRNIKRFPNDFMFSLSRKEILNLSQTVISSKLKHSPNVFVFTEQGIAMLSSVLRSDKAIQVNIQIMRTFIKIKQLIMTNSNLKLKIEKLEKKYKNHDEKIELIFEAIKQLLDTPKPKKEYKIGFRPD